MNRGDSTLSAQGQLAQGKAHVQYRLWLPELEAHVMAQLEGNGLQWLPDQHCYLVEEAHGDPMLILDTLDWLAIHSSGSGQHGKSATDEQGLSSVFIQAARRRSDLRAVERANLVARYSSCLAASRYSIRTAKNYTNAFRGFLAEIDPRLPCELAKAEVEAWLASRALATGSSISHQNTLINAIKIYYVSVENRADQDYRFVRPRREESLPSPLTKAEVQRMIALTSNVKHRCLLLVAYSTGLKARELLHLRSDDLRLDRMTIRVRAEGTRMRSRPDREVPLSPKLAVVLDVYFQQNNPRQWLFEGERQGQPYSERSAQMVVRQAALRAGIDRPITLHTLRDSYAIHQLEAGVALEAVQDLLGHGSIRSTVRYAQVARRKLPASPADELEL